MTGTTGTPNTSGLVLNVSEDAWQGNAQFTVTVDGKQVGGTYTATASHASGQSQLITISTVLGAGSHSVGITFINDAYGGSATTDRNLYVNSATYNGAGVSGAADALYQNGTDTFSVAAASTPKVTSTAVVTVSEDAWQGNAQFQIYVDGKQVGGTYTATASHAAGQSPAITIPNIAEAFAPHDIAVQFLNDAYGGSASTDRNLYVNSIQFDGKTVPSSSATLLSNGTVHFAAVAPAGWTGS